MPFYDVFNLALPLALHNKLESLDRHCQATAVAGNRKSSLGGIPYVSVRHSVNVASP